MPVTAKLSRQFYEKLGDEVANELVTWFNAVDEGYRQEFRDLFEAHFGRFEARLGKYEGRSDGKLGQMEARLNEFATRTEIAALEARVDVKLAALETRLIRWMFSFWIGTVVTVVAAMIALQRLR